MITETDALKRTGPTLKRSSGWFAAGTSFRHALTMLSDGAFRLFAFIALEADRRTGRFEATQTELARTLRKSRRAIGKYIAELEQKGICKVTSAANQYSQSKFDVVDEYWPYHKATASQDKTKNEEDAYVAAVHDTFLGTGCTRGIFAIRDAKAARNLHQRGVALELVRDAVILGACRKYISWLNGAASEPIGSLAYFEPLISDIQEHPFPEGYREHIESQLHKLARQWRDLKGNELPKPQS
jgi:hypothetical protein